jgi:hypothetical protein
VCRVLDPAETGLEEGEAGLHEEDDDRRDDNPHGVDRDDDFTSSQAGFTSSLAKSA